ncbi:MAG: cytochrome o ubiquinol oxidase subunit III [Alphaproteobacteria bacterium]
MTKENIKVYADDHHQDMETDTVFGFWIYLMTDCLLFATLFAVFAVTPQMPNAYGVMPSELFDLKLIATETALLLASSFTFGMAMLAMYANNLKKVISWLIVTLIFGLGFLSIEIYEFIHLSHNGAPINLNAYWAIFYGLVGTHGLHVTSGSIWMLVMFAHLKRDGLTAQNQTRLTCLSLFWHFLDLIWIAVFTIVYLLGVL